MLGGVRHHRRSGLYVRAAVRLWRKHAALVRRVENRLAVDPASISRGARDPVPISRARGRASAKVDSRFCPRTALGADVSGHNQDTIAKGKASCSKGSNPNLETQSQREHRRHG